MEVTLSAGDLVTVVGASAAGATIVQFLKMLFTLDAKWVRILCLIVGLSVVLGVGLTTGEPVEPVRTLLLSLVGMQAGMATYTMFDTARSGFDYQATRRPARLGVSVTPVDPEDAE